MRPQENLSVRVIIHTVRKMIVDNLNTSRLVDVRLTISMHSSTVTQRFQTQIVLKVLVSDAIKVLTNGRSLVSN